MIAVTIPMHLSWLRIIVVVLAVTWLPCSCLSANVTNFITSTAFIEDKAGTLTFDEVRNLTPVNYSGLLTKGFTSSVYWIRLTLLPSKQDGALILRIRPQYVDRISGYDPLNPTAAPLEAGDKVALPNGSYRSLNHNIAIPSAEQRDSYWLRVETTSTLILDVAAYTPNEILEVDMKQEFGLTVYLGILLMITFSSAIFYFSTRELLTAAFLIFQIFGLFFTFGGFGFFRLWLAQDVQPEKIDWATNHIMFGLIGSATLFYSVLLTKNGVRWRMLPASLALIVLLPVEIILFNTGQQRTALWLKDFSIFAVTLNLFLASFFAHRSTKSRIVGHTQRGLLIGFFGFLFVDLLLTLIPNQGVLRAIDFTIYNSAFIGLISGALMFIILYQRHRNIERYEIEGEHRMSLVASQLAQEQESRQNRDKLLSMLSHELKTPLAVAKMSLDNLSTSESVRDIKMAVSDMTAVLERTLQASRLDDGRMPLATAMVPFGDLVRQVIDSFGLQAQVCFHCGTEQLINSDPTILKIIISNLTENAHKYGHPEKPIDIRLRIDEREENFELSVANIPGKTGWPDRGEVFRKFYRSPYAAHQTGSGLGLYLVSELTRVLGGTIAYEPDQTHVRFVVCLPA